MVGWGYPPNKISKSCACYVCTRMSTLVCYLHWRIGILLEEIIGKPMNSQTICQVWNESEWENMMILDVSRVNFQTLL